MAVETGKLAFRRMIRNASLLGLLSLTLNIGTQRCCPENPIPLGNLFLFLSANVYGIIGGTISALISELPRVILNANNAVLVLKNISLTGVIGFFSSELPLLPSIVTLSGFWMICMTAVAWIMGELNSATLLLLFIYDTILLALSKMLLMSSSVSAWLTQQLRHVPAMLLLPECLFIATTLCLGILLVIPFHDVHGYELINGILGGSSLFVFGFLTLIPVMFGWVLTSIIMQDYGPEFHSSLLSHGTKSSFSGLSSKFWKQNRPRAIDSGIYKSKKDSETSPPPEPIGELSIGKDGSVLFLNALFREYAHLPLNAGLGIHLSKLSMHPQMREAIMSLLQEDPQQNQRVREVRIEDPGSGNSQFFEVHVELGRARSAEGDEPYNFKIKDITERRTVETHLLQAKKVESLGAMVSGIAHSFNDALTAITGQASLAKLSPDQHTVKHALDQILDASKQAGSLVQQLLDFALDTSNLRVTEDLNVLIDSRAELLRQSMGDAFELTIQRSQNPLPVKCNTNLLIQAITNLILNARESYESGTGSIILEIDSEEISPELSRIQPTVRPGQFARIRVKDTGAGMYPEVLARAFDPLFTTKSGAGHTGLGLSIVFAAVRAHDGFLTAESQPGSGTTISLYLPFATSNSSETQSNAHNISTRIDGETLRGKKILIIEDDPSVLGILDLLINSLGCKPLLFSSGLDVLKEIQALEFDLFLADLVLPAMSGIELAGRIRSTKGAHTPGVIMSGYAIDPSIKEMNLVILRKPFDLEDLKRALLQSLTSS